jgi:hypothetical protein
MTIRECVFIDNAATFGGAVDAGWGQALIENCVFIGNHGTHGSAVSCATPTATISGCTFTGNDSDKGTVGLAAGAQLITGCTFYANRAISGGSGVYCFDYSSPSIQRTVFANAVHGAPVSSGFFSYPTLACCDIYASSGGDWVGCIASQNGVNGNFSADPRFCGAADGDLTLEACSPCLPGHHPAGSDCGGAIGASAAGCACSSATTPTTWGAIKATYR